MKKKKRNIKSVPYYDKMPPLLQDYFKLQCYVKNRTDKTVRSYAYDLLMFLRYTINIHRDVEVEDFTSISIENLEDDFFKAITTEDIYEYMYYLSTERHNGVTTRYRKLEAIKSFFKYLFKVKHIIPVDVAADIELPNTGETLPKYLQLNECVQLLNSIDGSDKERDLCLFHIFLGCGLRLSETVGIDLQDIHGDKLLVYGKGQKERELYLTPICRQAINDYLRVRTSCETEIKDKDALFISRKTGKRLGERRVQQIVAKHLKNAGLQGYSVHKLRHTFATLLFEEGADIEHIQHVLGHESVATTQIYTHINTNQVKNIMLMNPLAKRSVDNG